MSEKPKRGDMIEIFRGLYQHWALYVGDGYVVHLAPPPEAAGAWVLDFAFSVKANVKKEKLKEVVGPDKWKISNYLDEMYKPRPADIIVKEACVLVGQELPYDVLRKNCEHFVTELRCGHAVSRQGDTVGTIKIAVADVSLGLAGLVARLAVGVEKEETQ